MARKSQSVPKVGVIGLGQMGGGVARNSLAAGTLQGVWDISPDACAPFGQQNPALVAKTPRDLGETCDVIIFVVPSSKEIAACLHGPDGILAANSDNQILLDLTTSDPEATKELAEHAATHGRAYLDAGMSGGATGADAGQLALMVGGEAETFERCKPAFEAIADMNKVAHVGPIGAGHTMKIVHNMVCHTVFMATAEGARVAQKAGIDLATAINVFNNGNAMSFVSQSRFPNHIISETWDARSRVANLDKDLSTGVAMARRLGVPPAFSGQTLALLKRAMATGMAEDDFSLLYKEFDRLAKEPPAG